MTDQVRRRLTEDTLVWLTTVSPSGRPAPRLVWFMWTGMTADEFTGSYTVAIRVTLDRAWTVPA